MIKAIVFDMNGVIYRNGLNRPVVDIIRKLAETYKVGILSNTVQSYLDEFLEEAGIQDLFAAAIASSDTGYLKPDPEIFEITAGRLGVKFDEMLYIDDSPLHVHAARTLGIASHLYESPGALGQWLDLKLPPN